MPVSVAGLAKNGDRYFVAQRKPGTSIGDAWEFPGGKAEPGETPESALKREYFEEFGVEIKVGGLRCKGAFSNGDKTYDLYAYDITLKGIPQTREHQRTDWKTPEELTNSKLAESDRTILRFLLMERTGRT